MKSSAQQASPVADAFAPTVAPVEKKPVFVITQNTKKTTLNFSTSTVEEKEKEKPKKGDTELINTKNTAESSNVFVGLPKSGEARTASAMRTSNCTKEEVDAILIQCGRLSHRSSGKASNDTGGGGHRKHLGRSGATVSTTRRVLEMIKKRTGIRSSSQGLLLATKRPAERSGSRESGSHRKRDGYARSGEKKKDE